MRSVYLSQRFFIFKSLKNCDYEEGLTLNEISLKNKKKKLGKCPFMGDSTFWLGVWQSASLQKHNPIYQNLT